MIKMTTELFNKFSTKQEELDSMIREKFGISEDEWKGENMSIKHGLALQVEKFEFINECHDSWKYWKKKSVVPERIIDEAIDVIHFIHLALNKHEFSSVDFVNSINGDLEELYENIHEVDMLDLIGLLAEEVNIFKLYMLLLTILDHYAFTLEDIEQAYDRKNNENFKRQERNY
ncbi:dUTP diphosphatase [Macrococcus armenti]|uniref:dUTP diphosphatase n=1 Tax=Macrococcus armenti TaxID=2875764 RepID=UPI001CCCDFAF|nr:dUTP diphosphatase [Macrococcus armenti]UBH07855.1 dUTP diphosphatase [Macrococcus armenti]